MVKVGPEFWNILTCYQFASLYTLMIWSPDIKGNVSDNAVRQRILRRIM